MSVQHTFGVVTILTGSEQYSNVCTMVRKPWVAQVHVSFGHSLTKLTTERWWELTYQHISRATLATTSDWHAFLLQTVSAVLFIVICCIHLISCTHSLRHCIIITTSPWRFPGPCMKTSTPLKMHLSWVIKSKWAGTELNYILFFNCTIVLQLNLLKWKWMLSNTHFS